MAHETDYPSEIKDELSFIFCGDTFLRTRDGGDPFSLIAQRIRGCTGCINCETSLKGKKEKEKIVSLSVDEQSLDCIPQSIAIINIVNNHIDDGSNSADMAVALRRRGKTVIGPDNPARMYTEIEGLSLEYFSAYFPLPRTRLSYGGALAAKMEAMIRESVACHKIVNLHWGYEHTNAPAPFQRELARRFVDAGASLIIGHHPHVPQGWEVYRGTSIFYSLGNFNFWLFDKEAVEENRWGYMVHYEPRSGRVQALPYRINDNYQPVAITDRDEEELGKKLESLCKDVRAIDARIWFTKHYKNWHSHEYKAWLKRCLKTKSPILILKYLVWMILPMQIRYYFYVVLMRISFPFFAKTHSGKDEELCL